MWKPDPENPSHYVGGIGFLFRDLTDEEEAQFRKYAREQPIPENTDLSIFHPVCQEEWAKKGAEAVTQRDLDNLKREFEHEIANLKQMVEDLRNDLRVEREARRSAVAELWEQTQTAK